MSLEGAGRGVRDHTQCRALGEPRRLPPSGKTSISDARTVMLDGVSKWTGLEVPMPVTRL
jgi:hypothetical protein